MIFAGSIRAVINTWHILWGRAMLAGAETRCSCYTAIRGWGWASDACSLVQPFGVMQAHWPFLPFKHLRRAAKQVKIGRQRLSCTVQSSDPYFLLYNCYNQQWVLVMLLWATVPKTISAGITVQHLESFGSLCDSLNRQHSLESFWPAHDCGQEGTFACWRGGNLLIYVSGITMMQMKS